ncbi:hypothetical protein BO71DRAFT_399208 [Aspergillus ellipticus CBS 707.79]|uniref:Uncharacterized protein n=1 Tax=Aspergillus ellipticus CBS 707.79 TaxID=1448320 RepID=A0A319D9L4_9EURO|nr:hypothetical protein BO71DRAFT_399208 [Aspergillus ellipticus CBS 707.79]
MSGTETFQSVLLGGSWRWDPNEASQIKFHENGTGTLTCRQELNIWIAAEFDWKLQSPECLEQTVNLDTKSQKPQVLSEFDIELTLTQRRISGCETKNYRINEALLTESAFEPKTYRVRLEKGKFLTQFDSMYAVSTRDSMRFALRLVFDKSPYPLREQWKEPDGAPDALRFWDWTEFCAREVPAESGVLSKILGLFQ